jgi:glutathione S-transferase
MTYTLITANRNYSSWSLRPWVLMKALGIAFEDRVEPFTKPVNYQEFRAFSPTGQVPVLVDGDRIVHDSLGIILYLADRHAGVWPNDDAARAWAQCAAAEMHSGFAALRNDCTMNVGVRVRPKPMSDALLANIARVRELWEEGLARFGVPGLRAARSAPRTPFSRRSPGAFVPMVLMSARGRHGSITSSRIRPCSNGKPKP